MRFTPEQSELLGASRIGMLALHGERTPTVNAIAFHHSGDSIWMTTSRYARKLRLIRRNPRAAFLVSSHETATLLQGLIEVYDPRSPRSQVRAALNGPSFYGGLAGYALKNLGFIGGYLLELDRVPGQWWPQNRLVMRLRVHRARTVEQPEEVLADPEPLPRVSRDTSRRLVRVGLAQACWKARGSLLLEPCYWSAAGEDLQVAFAPGATVPDAAELPAAVVIEKHHPFRPTLMAGACFRGSLTQQSAAEEAVRARYGFEPGELGCSYSLKVERVNSWRGFDSETR